MPLPGPIDLVTQFENSFTVLFLSSVNPLFFTMPFQAVLSSNAFKIQQNLAFKLTKQLPKVALWGVPLIVGGE